MISYNEQHIKDCAATGTPEQWKELRECANALASLMRREGEQRQQRLYKEEQERNIAGLKKLPPMSEVYFMSNNSPEIPYGTWGKKVSDGRKNMRVVFGVKTWLVDYKLLTSTKPEESKISVNRQLSRVLRNVL